MYSNEIYYEIISQQNKSIYVVIDLLDWAEEKITELQGLVTGGSLSLSGDSSIRRTCSLDMTLQEDYDAITSAKNLISINKKIRLRIGVENNLEKYKHLGEKVWFNLGIFILTSCSLSTNLESTTLSLQAQDKMVLLTGDVGGVIPGMLEVNKTYDEDNNFQYQTIEEIIRYAVVGLGGENPAKVIINDIPEYIKAPMIYHDSQGRTLTLLDWRVVPKGTPGSTTYKTGDYIGYAMEKFYYTGELIKQPGDTVASILDDIKHFLGNYEYFYDVDGNFVFQEVKNYLNTSFTNIEELTNKDYIANFDKTPFVFTFRDKHIVNAYTNNPNWLNIKNDFIVWGMADEQKGPIMYHLVVDDKPILPENYTKPWQQYLIDERKPLNQGDANYNPYWGELSSKFPQIYDSKKEEWITGPSGFTYYFDMIDTKGDYGEFSVGAIGKRTKTIIDDKVGLMYPPVVPNMVIINTEMDEIEKNKLIAELNRTGQNFVLLSKNPEATGSPQVSFDVFTQAPYSKDAFSVIREQLYQHTNFNESITINCLPLYFLNTNERIEVFHESSNIYGDYMIKSINLPLSPESLMSITAIRAQQRI